MGERRMQREQKSSLLPSLPPSAIQASAPSILSLAKSQKRPLWCLFFWYGTLCSFKSYEYFSQYQLFLSWGNHRVIRIGIWWSQNLSSTRAIITDRSCIRSRGTTAQIGLRFKWEPKEILFPSAKHGHCPAITMEEQEVRTVFSELPRQKPVNTQLGLNIPKEKISYDRWQRAAKYSHCSPIWLLCSIFIPF